jgi:6-hydroxynicotinate 3-monooxygenase
VYEQSPSFSRIGAGIILGANVAKVLRRLDLERRLTATGIRPDAFLSRTWDTGETTYQLVFDAECEARFDGPFVNIHRADLHELLKCALAPGTIRYSHKIAGIDETAFGVALSFENGAARRPISRSVPTVSGRRCAKIMLGFEEPRFIGRIAPRAVFPADRIKGDPIRDCTKWCPSALPSILPVLRTYLLEQSVKVAYTGDFA